MIEKITNNKHTDNIQKNPFRIFAVIPSFCSLNQDKYKSGKKLIENIKNGASNTPNFHFSIVTCSVK